MRVVVTGGAGFIGAHSCRALLEAGHAVTGLDDLSHGKREALPPGADLVVMDVRSPQLAAELERLRPEAVLHLAAQMDVRRSVADPMHDASVNVVGTVNALAAARRAGARRFVFASSGGAVYGEQETFPAPERHPPRPARRGAARSARLPRALRSAGSPALPARRGWGAPRTGSAPAERRAFRGRPSGLRRHRNRDMRMR